MKKFILFILIIFIVASFKQDKTPRFVGTVIAQFLDNGRQMKLINQFAFIDSKNRKWHVPAGHIVDGASIPKPFWSIIGGPFEGKYRQASVVHDYYCDIKIISWREVHRMFYEACITEGANEILAKTMYAAVYAGGPRWEKVDTGKIMADTIIPPKVYEASIELESFRKTQAWINVINPTISDIEQNLDKQIKVIPK